MARIVLGAGTSHSPMLSLPGELWSLHGQADRANCELVFPPDGVRLSYDEALATYVPEEIQSRCGDETTFRQQHARGRGALAALRDCLAAAGPDITIVITDDQDEWFFENNMPMFSIFWAPSVRLLPLPVADDQPEHVKIYSKGYGDVELDVSVPSAFGRHVIEHLADHDFDIAHIAYAEDVHGGTITRRYPTPDGEFSVARTTPARRRGLPHGVSFVVKQLFENKPGPILPVFLNTCYPPNQVRPGRAYDFGRGVAAAVKAWAPDVRVAVIASGGLSHPTVDEGIDRLLLDALVAKDEAALRCLPRHRLYSATSESLNWVAVAGAMAETDLAAEVVEYLPVYRTEAGTGGGWGFALWR